MRFYKLSRVPSTSLLTCVVAGLVATALWAGPTPFTITRTIDQEEDQCTAGPAVVTLQGDGSGTPTDPLTVVEVLNVSRDFSTLVLSDISHGGQLVDVFAVPEAPVGVFDGRLVLEIPAEPNRGSQNNTIHHGADSYTSLADTGRDIWTGGDTCEYAYTRFTGDFDVSVRIDTYDHETGTGCWGKYGIMARRTLEFNSRMVMAQNHGPQGTDVEAPDGPGTFCTDSSSPENQSTSLLGRRCHFGTTPTPFTNSIPNHSFEAVVGEPEVGDFPPPGMRTDYKYLRLTRRGNLFEGWGTDAPAVEGDPTLDANWEKLIVLAKDGGDYEVPATDGDDPTCEFPTGAIPCWYVGFANSEHWLGDPAPDTHMDLQTVDFTVLNWSATSCFATEPIGKAIEWTDVARSDVNAGLTYTANVAPGNARLRMSVNGRFGSGGGGGPAGLGLEKGIVGDATPIVGPNEIAVVTTEQVGALTLLGIGDGTGTLEADGSVFEMTGVGQDVWDNSDDFAFAYQQVTGDFDAVIQILGRNLPGGQSAKYGLMVRETCDPRSRNDFMTSRATPPGFTKYAFRRNHLTDGGSGEPYCMAPGVIPGENETLFPDFLRMIRTESQVTGYVAYEDPANAGQPLHWCVIGSRNVQERPVDHQVGVGISSHSTVTANEVDFTINVNAYAPAALPPDLTPGPVLFSRDFNSDPNGEPPVGAFWANRASSSGTGFGPFDPVVTNGRLRMTEDGIEDGATAVWFVDDALDDILETGFEAEYDVRIVKAGLPDPDPEPFSVLPGEGGMFVVVGGASDLFATTTGCPGSEDGTIPLVLPDENLGTVIGTDVGGISNTTVDRGDPGPEDDIYTNFNTSGGAIWMDCDQFSYDYTEITGDFDIVTEIIDVDHDTFTGEWSKWGLMAREGAGALATNNRYVAVHNDGFVPVRGTTVTARRSDAGADGCDDMVEQPFRPTSTFLRLTRRGDTIQGFGADDPELGLGGTLDRNNDCNWFPGPSHTLPDLDGTLNVGFFNHEESDSPLLTVTYRILGATPGGEVIDTGNLFVHGLIGHPQEMGLGGGGEHQDNALGLRKEYTCHPHFAVEVDTQVSPPGTDNPESINEGAGAPDNVGQYHIGVNTGGMVDSRQTNDNFGIDSEDLPDIFSEDGIHMRVVYQRNGEIEAWVSAAGSGGAAGGPVTEDKVLDTYIPPLNLGAGPADPVVGFVASNTIGGSQTLEFDNLTIRALADAGGAFKRGDGDASGVLNINDPIFNLVFQFLGGVNPVCKDALDTDDSGTVTINDPIISLTFQFLGGVTIPLPGPNDCGPDPTDDNEDCADYPQDKC